jgi:hypothetical protein
MIKKTVNLSLGEKIGSLKIRGFIEWYDATALCRDRQ